PASAHSDVTTLRVAGLQDRVTVRRDERGIPYIEAANETDLYFAQGYVTASDRLWDGCAAPQRARRTGGNLREGSAGRRQAAAHLRLREIIGAGRRQPARRIARAAGSLCQGRERLHCRVR